MPRNRLAPGVEVVAVPGRGLAVRTAEGEFLTVRTRHADENALLSLLSGAPGAPADEELRRVVRGFEEAGYLADAARPPRWPAARRDVRLLGDPALTGPLAAHLTALGAAPRTTPLAPRTTSAAPAVSAAPTASTASPPGTEELLEGNPAAVVWCLDGPVPDGLWDAADRLPEHGTAWLRCHREGRQAYVEPLAAAPGDVTAAHVRARRLAATPAHRELAAYWSGPRTSGEPVPLTVPAAALLAALLADDLARWATGAPDGAGASGVPARRRLRQVDLRTLTVTEHPVLPVPAVVPTPAVVPVPAAVPVPAVVPVPTVVPIPKKDG
ncbi:MULTISPECIES: hypothetical protein [unclassified Streptomyces]|uniref:hypothetical protein n=1 Tax=unclassified Streptomyces TaxID=2593676 RepID=UPI0035D55909